MAEEEDGARPGIVELGKRSPASAAIGLVCVVLFLATLGMCVSQSPKPGLALLESLWSLSGCRGALEGLGALSLARVWVDGEWWRVATTGLLHGSWLHLVLNVWSLWVVGQWCELAWGSWRTAAVFGLASVAGCLSSLFWCEAPMVVGASAGVMGLAGGLVVSRIWGEPKVRRLLHPVSARALSACLVALLLLGWVVPVIAQAGHVGGLLAGLWLGVVIARKRTLLQEGLGLAMLAGALGALGWAAAHPDWRPGYHEFLGYRLLELGEGEGAQRSFERALADRPSDPVLANAVAYALAEAGTDLERAEQLVEGALAEEPENADYLDTLGWILCRRGQVAAGMIELRRAEAASSQPIPEISIHLETCDTARID